MTVAGTLLDLSIIIVSWNVAELLAACLDSILSNQANTQLQIEILVVDSASSDHTVNMIKERYPQVNLLTQTKNVGFTRGNNIGLEIAKGRHILLLNPDTEVIDSALPVMIEYLDNNPQVGIVGPHTLNSNRTTQSTRRRFPTVTTGFFESTWLERFAPQSLFDHYYANDIADTAIAEVDWVQGSALMARREVYTQIGGLDVGYIMFSEELDWCKRTKDAGWRVVYLGTAQIIHHGGQSTAQVAARKHIHFQESKLRYFRKYHGKIIAHSLRIFLLLIYLWQIGLESGKGLLGSNRPLRRERVKAYWQIIRSGLKVT